jgi:hypothetical protein
MEVDAFSPTNTTGTDTVNGLLFGNLTDPGSAITSNAFNIGTGWDREITFNDSTPTIRLGATDDTSILSITDSASTPNVLLRMQDHSTNFGASIEAGAFIDYNSMYNDEFFKDRAQVTADGNQNWGDNTEWNTDETGTCTWDGQPDTSSLNGVTIMTAGAAASTCTLRHADLGAATPNTWLDADNLPTLVMKVRPSVASTGVPDTDHQFFAGMADGGAAAAPASGAPTNGIYFSNASDTAGVTGTANWYAVTDNGASSTNTACSVAVSETQYALLIIKVMSTSLVKFYIDGDVSNGISLTECGTGNTANINTAGMTPYLKADWDANSNAANLEVDFFRAWQDDNVQSEEPASTPVAQDMQSESLPLTPDSSSLSDQIGIIAFMEATAEDTVFEHNVYVKGTLFADKIRANQIEGLEVYTDQISNLQQRLTQAEEGTSSAGSPEVLGASTMTIDLNVGGGLTVAGDAQFHGNAFFYKLVTFVEKTVFKNDITFAAHIQTEGQALTADLGSAAGITSAPEDNPNASVASVLADGNDISGQFTINFGENATAGQVLTLKFKKPYAKPPNILLTPANDKAGQVQYYVRSTKDGFTLVILSAQPSGTSLQFNYWASESTTASD